MTLNMQMENTTAGYAPVDMLKNRKVVRRWVPTVTVDGETFGLSRKGKMLMFDTELDAALHAETFVEDQVGIIPDAATLTKLTFTIDALTELNETVPEEEYT